MFRAPPPPPRRRLTLIAAVLIIAIATAVFGYPKLMAKLDRGHEPKIIAAKADIILIMQGLSRYKRRVGRYPTTGQGLLAMVIRPTIAPIPKRWEMGGYVDRLPRDPWGNSYQYRTPGIHQDAEVFSYGPDGPVGGEDGPGVIGSWQLKWQ
ncbi:type II secretion system major pseudopilin GspG [Herbaspirillum sp. RTI4]|uniref:type II secretion system major pseudopilin GspG n=1 Tax=Herbaspirillum sp. RTI4 TaxID=3048640 RepID=UPI002AB4FDF9|nr:type II secretion system major pseudopilin GspG [Herbaspirillum sp. RTI4]MDY7577133.1 type II secretion system major pseudopilin GspG [Herbaspirillum sp. RTI4]MEA9982875.1 type II secretion system major pseudopilin GspG [Herbaspirillum sp. RTI4]